MIAADPVTAFCTGLDSERLCPDSCITVESKVSTIVFLAEWLHKVSTMVFLAEWLPVMLVPANTDFIILSMWLIPILIPKRILGPFMVSALLWLMQVKGRIWSTHFCRTVGDKLLEESDWTPVRIFWSCPHLWLERSCVIIGAFCRLTSSSFCTPLS